MASTLIMVKHFIEEGETDNVEFKQEEVKAKNIAETICAFANKKGGTILFGIKDKTKEIIGVRNSGEVIEKIENANRDLVIPMASIKIEIVEYEGQKIVMAQVEPGSTLHTAYKTHQIYVRTGKSNSPADVDTVIRILNERGRLYFEDFPIEATFEDLDIEKVNLYLQ